jgi:V8-like Glu-specific endopeptidase
MKVYLLYFLVFILPLGLASNKGRKVANIFVEDDRISLERGIMPAIGSIHTKAERRYIIGTGFLIDSCHIATSYHLIKSSDEKISKEDFIYFNAGPIENFVKAHVVSYGRPNTVNVHKKELEDWAILRLEKCSESDPLKIKTVNFVDLQNKELKLYGFPRDRDFTYISLDASCAAGHEPNPYFEGIPHDCAVRAGNSGGPLVLEVNGESFVVGIQSTRRRGFDDIFSEYMSSWANMATPIAPVVDSFKNLKSSHQQEEEDHLYRPH